MKPDERAFWLETGRLHGWKSYGRTPANNIEPCTDTAQRLGINEKRVYHFLDKATKKKRWSYGVNARWGWFEPEGATWVKQLRDEVSNGEG